MRIEDQIKECEQLLLEAMKNHHIDQIAKLLHDDLLFVIPTGQVVTKEMDLENMRSGTLKIENIIAKNQLITVVDDIATVTVTIQLKANYAGNEIDGSFQYLRVWKSFENSWKVISGSGFQLLDH